MLARRRLYTVLDFGLLSRAPNGAPFRATVTIFKLFTV